MSSVWGKSLSVLQVAPLLECPYMLSAKNTADQNKHRRVRDKSGEGNAFQYNYF
jgi:hypothetical protein